MAGKGKSKPTKKKNTKKGKVLSLYRRHHDWTMKQLAEKVGCSMATVRLAFVDAGINHREDKAEARGEKVQKIVYKAAEKAVANTQDPRIKYMEKCMIAWGHDMALFVEQAMGINGHHGYTMSTQQREACDAVSRLIRCKEAIKLGHSDRLSDDDKEYAKKIGISIMSGQGPGKDAWLAWFIVFFLFNFPNVLIPCTAPGQDQLKNILWSEVSRWLNRQDIDGNYLVIDEVRDSIVIQGDKIFLKAFEGKKNFAFPKTANPKDDAEAQAKTLYGYHEEYMAIVIDEASGVSDPVFKPLEGTLTGLCNFILMAFNPYKRTGFALDSQIGTNSNQWVKLHWNAEDSEIVSRESIEAKAAKWGRLSNSYRTLVKGLPPLSEPDTLIPYDWVIAASERELIPDPTDPMIGGLDPGGGGDESVLTVRQGPKIIMQEKFSSPDTMQVTAWACGIFRDYELVVLGIDNIGIGAGVYDRMRELDYNVVSVDARRSARDEDRFDNVRAELWWKGRDRFEAGIIQIPPDQMLMEELWGPKFDREGKKIKVETKAMMKKRLEAGRSPNHADSLLISLYLDDDIYRRDLLDPADAYYDTQYGVVNQEYAWMGA
jgi:phage terminase large subunit